MTSAPLNLFEFEPLAREKMATMGWGYYASGANDEITLRENHAAFDRIRLRPRVLVDVSNRSTQTRVVGQTLPSPITIAPTAFHKLAHPEGESATARAAAARGITMCLSTLATSSIEEVRAAAGPEAPLWYQLYVFKDKSITADLVRRAEQQGYTALVLTVDSPLLGRREADIRNQFHLPEGLYAKNVIGTGHEHLDPEADDSGLAAYLARNWDPSLTWADIAWFKSITDMPVLVKGVLRSDDARQAIAHGVDGIVVSNHGGRQVDTAPATIEVLPDIIAAVDGQVDVLMDGGIRRGTDVIKALAYGAKAVMVGRPILWGLAYDGEAGVGRVLDLLHNEIDLAMALVGAPTVEAITPDLIAP